METAPLVSIVIVCMNRLDNLYPCLDSLRKHTAAVSYETLVVAYRFSDDNLSKVRADYPWADTGLFGEQQSGPEPGPWSVLLHSQ